MESKPKFKIGDVVKITNVGERYCTHKRAFLEFGLGDIMRINARQQYVLPQASQESLQRNWIIASSTVIDSPWGYIYHIKSKLGFHLVIGERGISLVSESKSTQYQRITTLPLH